METLLKFTCSKSIIEPLEKGVEYVHHFMVFLGGYKMGTLARNGLMISPVNY